MATCCKCCVPALWNAWDEEGNTAYYCTLHAPAHAMAGGASAPMAEAA